jgi:uncharacterized protein (DUF433 family)
LEGYEYRYASGSKEPALVRKEPVVEGQEDANRTYASFLGLMDLLFVKQFLDRGISLQKLRRALDEVVHTWGIKHFANRTFFTDTKRLYLQIEESDPAKKHSRAIMELLTGGQQVFVPVIEHLAERIQFHDETGFARRWFPDGRSAGIVVDPSISFGRPSILGRGIPTANIYARFVGENKDIGQVSHWMDLDESQVAAAVRFELAA